jgi:translation initiation factor 1
MGTKGKAKGRPQAAADADGLVYGAGSRGTLGADSPFAALAAFASTDPDPEPSPASAPNGEPDALPAWSVPPRQQTLYVACERKQRAGRPTTVVEGFDGTEAELEALGRALKKRCGVGGAVKEGAVLVQGDHRPAVIAWLEAAGFKAKRKGG